MTMMSAQQQPISQLQHGSRKSTSSSERVSVNVRVVARLRPMTVEEKEAKDKIAIQPLRKMVMTKSKSGVSSETIDELPLTTSSSHSQQSSKLLPPRAIRRSSTPPRYQQATKSSSKAATPDKRSGDDNNNNNNASHVRKPTNKFCRGGHVVTSLIAGIENRSRFEYDAVFPSKATQKEVYDGSVGDIVRQDLFRGYNVSIICTGSKSSGKSYTMSGGWKTDDRNKVPLDNFKSVAKQNDDNISMVTAEEGILPRIIYDLFKTRIRHEVNPLRDDDNANTTVTKVTIKMSFIEIADEGIRDILADSDPTSPKPNLNYQNPDTFEAKKLAWITVESPNQVKELLGKASKNRAASVETSINPSHFICRFHVAKVTTSKNEQHRPERVVSRLTIANLSGPDFHDNASKNRACVKEMQALCNSISLHTDEEENVDSSVQGKRRPRKKENSDTSSILLRVLRNSFGGNCRTVLIACLSPTSSSIEASMDTLRLAEKARKVTNRVRRTVECQAFPPATYNSGNDVAAVPAKKNSLEEDLFEESNQQIIMNDTEKANSTCTDKDDEETATLTSTEELSSLQMKAKEAETAMMHARECSISVAEVVDRWRLNRKKLSNSSKSLLQATEAARERADSTTTNSTPRLEETVCSSETDSDQPDETEPEIGIHRSGPSNTKKGSETSVEECLHPIVGANIDTIPSAVSGLTDTEVSPPISAASSYDNFEQGGALNQPGSQSSTNIAENFKLKLCEALERRRPLAIKEAASETESIDRQRELTSTTVEVTREQVVQPIGDSQSCQENTPKDDDAVESWTTKRKMISSAVEIILLNRKLLAGVQNEARLQKKLDEITSRSTLHQVTSKGMIDRMVLLEGMLKKQRDWVDMLSKEKEKKAWEENNLIFKEAKSEQEGREESLQQALESTKKILAAERFRAHGLSHEKDAQICLLKAELKTQEENTEKLANEMASLQDQFDESSEQLKLQKFQTESLRSELAGTKRKLSEELMVINELEKIHETFRRKGDLQDQRIRKLAKQLQLYSQQIKQKDFELTEMKIMLGREGTIKGLAQDTKEEPSNNPGLSIETRSVPALHQPEISLREISGTSGRESIGARANKMLHWACRALESDRGSSVDESFSGFSEGTELRPQSSLPPHVAGGDMLSQVIISNIGDIGAGLPDTCKSSLVSRNLECVEFYLPKIGLTDGEGRDDLLFNSDESGDILTLDSILRPWQVEFLNSVGVKSPVDLVRLQRDDGRKVARSLRRWRREQNLPSIKIKSCETALHIWSRSCKAAIQSFQEQKAQGVTNPRRPDFLDVSSCSMSTLGLASTVMDANSQIDGAKDILFIDEA